MLVWLYVLKICCLKHKQKTRLWKHFLRLRVHYNWRLLPKKLYKHKATAKGNEKNSKKHLKASLKVHLSYIKINVLYTSCTFCFQFMKNNSLHIKWIHCLTCIISKSFVHRMANGNKKCMLSLKQCNVV